MSMYYVLRVLCMYHIGGKWEVGRTINKQKRSNKCLKKEKKEWSPQPQWGKKKLSRGQSWSVMVIRGQSWYFVRPLEK